MIQLLFDFFSGKAKTRIYTTFMGWLLLFHIDIIFLSFFTDQQIIFNLKHQLKGEYVLEYISNLGILIEFLRVLATVLVTYLMIWIVPRLINVGSYRAELEIEYTLRKMKLEKEEQLNQKEKDVVEQQLENIQTEKQVAVERASLIDFPERIEWESEYKKFRESNMYRYFNRVVKAVYQYNGHFSGTVLNPPPAEVMAYLDTSGIINLNQGSITFTDKGKYFVQRSTLVENI